VEEAVLHEPRETVALKACSRRLRLLLLAVKGENLSSTGGKEERTA